MKRFYNFLSILLSLAVLVGMLPAIPAGETLSLGVEATDVALQSDEKVPAIVLGEITDLRDKYTKHFRMSDGTMVAATYPEAVHFMQDGKWSDVDNSLSESTDATGKAVLENRNNGFKIRYARQSDSRNLVSMNVNGLDIRWGLDQSNAVTIKKNTMTETATSSEDIISDMKAQNTKSAVTYTEILPGIDLEYITKPEQVKENIILKSRDAQNSVSFIYDFGGLEPRLNADNSITLLDPANLTATGLVIAPPYMVDSKYEYSHKITVTIEKIGKEYKLTILADREWLDARERVYPVTIDPTLQTTTTVSAIRDGYASGNDPNSYWYNTIEFLRVADQNSSGFDCITYIRFSTMPVLKPSDQVVDAQLVLVPMYRYTGSSSHIMDNTFIPKPYINAYKVTEYWDTTTAPQLTYNNQPSAESIVLDYETVDGNDSTVNTRDYVWNVTRAAKEWYQSGNNFGIKLKMSAELPTSTWFAHFVSSDYLNTDPSDRPAMMITYRNTSGLEGYYSYHQQGTGRAGTGYVNDYTGNLVFIHSDAATTGNIMPAALNHVYGNDKRIASINYGSTFPKYGQGWSVDAIQKIEACDAVLTAAGYPYKYIDGDGTDHYFYHDPADATGIYVDEDGLGLKLQVYTSIQESLYWFKITDKSGFVLQFDKQTGTGGMLRKALDPNGNSNQYTYSYVYNGISYYYRLSTVTDGVGRTITLSYNASHQLSSITAPGSRVTTYSYSGENLVSINYQDSKISQYQYNGLGGSLSKVTNLDGYSIEYTYEGAISPTYRVKTILEKNGTSTEGGKLTVTYAHNSTTFTDNRATGKAQTYQFNNWGNTVSVNDAFGNGGNYQYNNASTSKTNHSLATAADINKPVVNLLSNPSFENSLTGWLTSPNGTVTTGTTNRYIGNYGLSVTGTDPADNACAYAYTTAMTGLPAGTYTVSAYVKSSGVVNDGFTGAFGAGIDIKITNNGVDRYLLSDLLQGTSDTSIDGGWRRVSLTFTLVAGDVLARVYFGVFNCVGTAYIDGVQLETGASMNRYNLVENSSFERNSGAASTPDAWYGYNVSATDEAYAGNAADGSWSYKIAGDPAVQKKVYQPVDVNGSEGDVYSLSGRIKADSAGQAGGVDAFCLCIRVNYDDGSSQYMRFPFNRSVGAMQTLSTTFVIDDGTSADKTYNRLFVNIQYFKNVNTAYIDNIQLSKDSRQSYQYDEFNNLVSTSDKAEQDSSFAYKNDNMAKMANPDGSSYEYAYDTSKRISMARSSEGLKYNFTYSGVNPLTTEIRNDAYSESIIPGTIYYIRGHNSAKYLNLYNGGSTAGTLVKQLTMNRTTAQQWRVVSAGGGYYKLVPQNATSMAMEVTGGSAANSATLQISTAADSDAQKFKLVLNANGTYQILTKASADKSGLDVSGASKDENAAVVQYTYSGNSNQCWIFEPIAKVTTTSNWDAPADGSVYYIRSRLTGKYVDIYNANTSDGTRAIQYSFSGSRNQQFKLVSGGNGYYKLQPLHSTTGKVLGKGGLNGYGERMICLYTNKTSDDDDQYFRFNKTGTTNSAYNIISKTDDVSTLDISQNSYNDSMDIILSAGTTEVGKEFILEKVSDKITSSAAYTTNGNYLTEVTDARGGETTYNFDTTKGTLTNVKAPGEADADKTNYTYDTVTDALKSVWKMNGSQTVTNTYDYVDDRLDKISHNDFDYRFSYDEWGNTEQVKVGAGTNLQTLVTNTYKPYNGLLDTVTYGNGSVISYVYDEKYDYLTSLKYGGVEKFNYVYNNTGNLFQKQDLINNQTIRYMYDFIDRITQVKNSNGHELYYYYDSKNRLSSYVSSLNGVSTRTGYVYGDPTVSSSQKAGLIYGIKVNDVNTISYGYDSLARRASRAINFTTPYSPFNTAYSYLHGEAADSTTTLLESITNSGTYYTSNKISYTYDAKGNISMIYENNVLKATYSYDNLSQLKREDNVYTGKSIDYLYDVGGNLTSRAEYYYSNGARGAPIHDYIYKYGYTDRIPPTGANTAWKDLLTTYDGQNIDYDAIGNPTIIGASWFLSWQNGRQLSSMYK
ncbi:MAG: RICIN domain-containing protein, partial [Saccharofermentanales bacterium]